METWSARVTPSRVGSTRASTARPSPVWAGTAIRSATCAQAGVRGAAVRQRTESVRGTGPPSALWARGGAMPNSASSRCPSALMSSVDQAGASTEIGPASSCTLAIRIALRRSEGARVIQLASGCMPMISEWACWAIWRTRVAR
ncbi:hypothetical protein SMICM304S_01841 [Streptomyces microflavus]